jgi:hypothetical protein
VDDVPLRLGRQTRAGAALAHACLSHYDSDRHADPAAWRRQLEASPVRVQWDPERTIHLAELPYRSVQVGLGGGAVARYVDEWTVSLTDITPTVRAIHALLRSGDEPAATALLPVERPYPLPASTAAALGATPD